MAAGLLRTLANEKGLDVEVRTAGLAHHPSAPVAKDAVAVMDELSIDISDEYSKPVTRDSLDWADFIVPVQRNHASHLLEDYPEAAPKVRLLEEDVPDPFCGPVVKYRNVRDQLKTLVLRFIESERAEWK